MDISTFLRIVSLSSALLALLVLVCAHVYISLKQQAEDEPTEDEIRQFEKEMRRSECQ